MTPADGNAGASAQLGAYQHPDDESDPVCNVTSIGSPDVFVTCKRPCLIPGYHCRNASHVGATVGDEPEVTGNAVRLEAVPSHRSRPPIPPNVGAGDV